MSELYPLNSIGYNSRMPDWSGRILGKVHVEGFIARGGMADVYLGEHTTLGRKVAVKIMRDHVDQDPDTVLRFEREAHVVAGLRHPNIIQMYDYDLADGQPCLIMEYVPGPSLSVYLKALHGRGETLPLASVSRLLNSLADALDYAHSLNIVHRDIKPANVLLRSTNGIVDIDQPLPADVEPIITDFGLVRLLDSSIQTSTGAVSGTPTYMSPEQARGDKVGPYTDIYSLGVMLYEMLAGMVPFEADSTFGVLMKHLNDAPPPIFGISPDLQAVIERTLAKEPNLRYNSVKELAVEFESILDGQRVSPGTLKLAQKARKSIASHSGKNKVLNWSWLALGLLAVAAIVFSALRFSPGLSNQATDPNQPVGRVTYSDFNGLMDKATIILNKVPAPETGTHYAAWYLSQGGESRRNVGTVTMDDSGQGQLVFILPGEGNILETYDQLEVTREADNDPKPEESSGDVVASFIFPPLALVHVRHVLVSFDSAPDKTALIQGLWSSADDIDIVAKNVGQAFKDGDEALLRKQTEALINELVGKADKERYRDWNGDGTIEDIGDGFGLFANGYLPAIISHTNFAMQAVDATENIQLRGGQLLTCLENMQGWSDQLLNKALQLQDMPFGPQMDAPITEMTALANQIVSGVDSNNNGLIEPTPGEGGADTAYEHAYYLADMPLLPGANRIPPPAPTAVK